MLYNLKLTLELNNFKVITAKNGVSGLEKLNEIEDPPDLIISDIMMPEMDGYTFFKKVSENIKCYQVPFIFLSAKAQPDDIKFAKLLGVDDYITKPFLEDDLLPVIYGKIKRREKIDLIKSKLQEEYLPSITKKQKGSIILIHVVWDDKLGPKVVTCYPLEQISEFCEKIGFQVYQSAVAIYGQKGFLEPQTLLLNIQNYNMECFLLFDSKESEKSRTRRNNYMLGVLAPQISYFHSLKLKNILLNLSQSYQKNMKNDYSGAFKEIGEILYKN